MKRVRQRLQPHLTVCSTCRARSGMYVHVADTVKKRRHNMCTVAVNKKLTYCNSFFYGVLTLTLLVNKNILQIF